YTTLFRSVDFLGHRHRDRSVVCRQTIDAFVLDRTIVGDRAVDGVKVDVGRIDAVENDVAVGRLGGDVAGDVGEADAFVDAADFETPLRLLDRDQALDRLERDEARSAAHRDVAAGRVDVDVAA